MRSRKVTISIPVDVSVSRCTMFVVSIVRCPVAPCHQCLLTVSLTVSSDRVFDRSSLAIHPNRTTIATGQCAGTKSDAQVSGSCRERTGTGRDGTGRTERDGMGRDGTGRDGARQDGMGRGGTGRDGTDGTGWDETSRDETRRDETRRDETRRDETKRDGLGEG